MAKGRLLLVVGAGASVEFGMPSVAECGAIISQEAQQFYPLADTPCTNFFAHVEATVAQYWRNHVPAHLYRDPQFEDILYVLFALAAAYPAGAYTSALGALIDARKLPEIKFCGRERQSIGADQLRGLAHASVDVYSRPFVSDAGRPSETRLRNSRFSFRSWRRCSPSSRSQSSRSITTTLSIARLV